MLDEMKKLDFKHWPGEDLRSESTLGVSQTTLDRIKDSGSEVLPVHKHLKEEKEKEKEKTGSEADGWLAASSSSSAANPTQPEIAARDCR